MSGAPRFARTCASRSGRAHRKQKQFGQKQNLIIARSYGPCWKMSLTRRQKNVADLSLRVEGQTTAAHAIVTQTSLPGKKKEQSQKVRSVLCNPTLNCARAALSA